MTLRELMLVKLREKQKVVYADDELVSAAKFVFPAKWEKYKAALDELIREGTVVETANDMAGPNYALASRLHEIEQ